jgi:hypothetical protein
MLVKERQRHKLTVPMRRGLWHSSNLLVEVWSRQRWGYLRSQIADLCIERAQIIWFSMYSNARKLNQMNVLMIGARRWLVLTVEVNAAPLLGHQTARDPLMMCVR